MKTIITKVIAVMKMIVTIKIIVGKTIGLIREDLKEVNTTIREVGVINGEASVTVGLVNVAGDNPSIPGAVTPTMKEITLSTEGADSTIADAAAPTEEDANLVKTADSNMVSPDAVRSAEKILKVVAEVLLQWNAKKFAALPPKEAVHPTVARAVQVTADHLGHQIEDNSQAAGHGRRTNNLKSYEKNKDHDDKNSVRN